MLQYVDGFNFTLNYFYAFQQYQIKQNITMTTNQQIVLRFKLKTNIQTEILVYFLSVSKVITPYHP